MDGTCVGTAGVEATGVKAGAEALTGVTGATGGAGIGVGAKATGAGATMGAGATGTDAGGVDIAEVGVNVGEKDTAGEGTG